MALRSTDLSFHFFLEVFTVIIIMIWNMRYKTIKFLISSYTK